MINLEILRFKIINLEHYFPCNYYNHPHEGLLEELAFPYFPYVTSEGLPHGEVKLICSYLSNGIFCSKLKNQPSSIEQSLAQSPPSEVGTQIETQAQSIVIDNSEVDIPNVHICPYSHILIQTNPSNLKRAPLFEHTHGCSPSTEQLSLA